MTVVKRRGCHKLYKRRNPKSQKFDLPFLGFEHARTHPTKSRSPSNLINKPGSLTNPTERNRRRVTRGLRCPTPTAAIVAPNIRRHRVAPCPQSGIGQAEPRPGQCRYKADLQRQHDTNAPHCTGATSVHVARPPANNRPNLSVAYINFVGGGTSPWPARLPSYTRSCGSFPLPTCKNQIHHSERKTSYTKPIMQGHNSFNMWEPNVMLAMTWSGSGDSTERSACCLRHLLPRCAASFGG